MKYIDEMIHDMEEKKYCNICGNPSDTRICGKCWDEIPDDKDEKHGGADLSVEE